MISTVDFGDYRTGQIGCRSGSQWGQQSCWWYVRVCGLLVVLD